MDERPMDPCPRCGGEYRPVRQFTRWGRAITMLACRDCQYTRHALVTAGTQQ